MLSGWIFVLHAAAKSPQSFLAERCQYQFVVSRKFFFPACPNLSHFS